MSCLHLNLECARTDNPAEEIRRMLGIANMLRVNVVCVVNDVLIIASPGDEVDHLIALYGRQKERRAPYTRLHAIADRVATPGPSPAPHVPPGAAGSR